MNKIFLIFIFFLCSIFFIFFSKIYYIESEKYYSIAKSSDGSLFKVRYVCGEFLVAFEDDPEGTERVKKVCSNYFDINQSAYEGDIKKICKSFLDAFPEIPVVISNKNHKERAFLRCYLRLTND